MQRAVPNAAILKKVKGMVKNHGEGHRGFITPSTTIPVNLKFSHSFVSVPSEPP